MILTSLTLHNFRSYTKKLFHFSPSTTLILGPNAVGKTNLLEALMFFATGKSFRAGSDREAIRWETELSDLTCQVSHEGEKSTLQIMLTQGEVGGQRSQLKKYLVSGIPRRLVDFMGHIRVVLFWPEDLEIVTDSPSIRRKYLDTVLVQVDREYRRNLLSYERGLRQRNRLLDFINEGTAPRSQLLFWDQLLIRAGGYLTDKRSDFISYVNSTSLREHTFNLMYDKSVISESRLEQYKNEEVAAKSTLVGPHRDDFHIESREKNVNRDMSKFGSRGEQRLAVLWLKLAELTYIEQATGTRPILLLDDIFSELDHEHRDIVASVTGQQQTIITSADVEAVPSIIRRQATTVQL